MNKKIVIGVVGGIVLVGLIAVGIGFTRNKPVSVSTVKVERGDVESTVSNTRAGEVQACQRTKLSTIMGGRIEFLGVKEGDRVKKGQLLMRLWNEDQSADITVARAQVDTTQRRITEACAAAANAVREADRIHALQQKGFVSTSKDDQTRSEAKARQASCSAAQSELLTAQARVRAAETVQRRTVIVAPFDGTVAKISGELGEYATPSPPGVPTPPVIDLIDDSCLYIKAPMDEVDAPKIQPGLPVRIKLDALSGKVFEGRVRRVAPYISAVEKQARTVDIEVDFVSQEAARGLLVGYSTDVEVLLERRSNTLRIPTGALREGRKVLILNADQRLEEREVKTGLANWQFTEILSGLEAGTVVVTSLEREGVKPGVRAIPESKS